MQLLLPDFEPRTLDNESIFENALSKRQLTINLSPAQGAGDVEHQADNLNYYLNKQISDGSMHYKKQATAKYGMTHYVSQKSEGWEQDLYVYTDGGQAKFILKCGTEETIPNPLCEATLLKYGNTILYYSYPIKNLPYAIEINQRIDSLIYSFKKAEKLNDVSTYNQ